MKIHTISDLYQYFDLLAESDASADDLFSSSYIRGFVSLAASEFGDEQQTISTMLIENVGKQMAIARSELSPEDRSIVNTYWQQLKSKFTC